MPYFEVCHLLKGNAYFDLSLERCGAYYRKRHLLEETQTKLRLITNIVTERHISFVQQ